MIGNGSDPAVLAGLAVAAGEDHVLLVGGADLAVGKV